MISIIKSPSYNNFFNLIKESKSNIYLCAPFIKKEIVDKILEYKKEGIEMMVITSANISNFLCGSLDISAIKKLIKQGVIVRNYQNLHAKIYIFDKKKALVTSANLTNNALYNNYEYGILIDDNTITDKIYNDYVEMINNDECGIFNIQLLDKLEKIKQRINKKPIVSLDFENDVIIIEEKNTLIENMSSWQQDIFEIINELANDIFVIENIYSYKEKLKLKHLKNNNIEAKIRQILQQLRDMGFIKFVNKGIYKKMWIDKSKIGEN